MVKIVDFHFENLKKIRFAAVVLDNEWSFFSDFSIFRLRLRQLRSRRVR
jgi:hypothetical protein